MTPSPAPCDDVRLWPAVAVSAPLGAKLQIRADALVETTDTGARTGLDLIRIVVLRRAGDRVTVGGGYAHVRGDTASGTGFVEHRALQELNLRILGDTDGPRLTSRTRLEERRRNAQSGLALRLRHQTRLELPLPDTAVRAVLWSEYFHSFNATAWSGPSGPGQMLTFVGVRLPLTTTAAIEPGYLNQITLTGPSRTRHIGALTVALRF